VQARVCAPEIRMALKNFKILKKFKKGIKLLKKAPIYNTSKSNKYQEDA
jgi:hypothetical protein